MRRRKIVILSRDPLLKEYLRQRLVGDPVIDVVEGMENNPEAIVMDDKFLTRAERELLWAIAKYGSVKKAAAKLYRSERTLKRELATIREKLGFRTTLQAVVWALQNGVISMDEESL